MAPKNLPPAAKQSLILQWFHKTASAYSIKELEKIIPSVASINGMQVKDYIQALTDGGLVRVEKIGSGNWYWSFVSDAKKGKEKVLGDLKAEESKLEASINETERQIEEEMAQRNDDEEMLEDDAMDRKALLETYETLLKQNEILERDLENYRDTDPTEILRKVKETALLKESTERWTDNIDAIESFLIGMTHDRAQVNQIMESVCGEEYIPGEGLKEL